MENWDCVGTGVQNGDWGAVEKETREKVKKKYFYIAMWG